MSAAIARNQPERHNVRFIIGSRQLFAAARTTIPIAWSLNDLILGAMPDFPDCETCDGYLLRSAPIDQVETIRLAHPGFIIGGRQDYRRHYIDMDGSYDDYLARFSSKTRSTLKRKGRKLAKLDGGALDIRAYHKPEELNAFLDHALPLSARTYQARLLDSGLPESPGAREEMRLLAKADRLRAYLLFMAGEPIAYLYLPVEDDTLIYAFLGYAPESAHLSPGTILQMAALEQLFAEQRYRYFDFTEGEGAHKAQFGSNSMDCATFLLLKPTLANRALLNARAAFDGTVAGGRHIAQRSGALSAIRRLIRR